MNWWEGVNDVTEEDVFSIIRLYNDFVRVFEGGFKYHIKVTKNFFKHKNYGDAIQLFRLIEGLETKPRLYLSGQFNLYKTMLTPDQCLRCRTFFLLLQLSAGISIY